MFCFKVVSAILALAVVNVNGGGLAAFAPVARLASPLLTNEVLTASAPALLRAAPAPLLAPATIGYRTAIPQNIPPFASQVSIVNRALAGYYAAPFSAALTAPLASPFAAPYVTAPIAASLAAPVAAPLPAPVAAPLAASVAAPLAAPVAASLAAPLAAPLLRAPLAYASSPFFGVRSTFAAPLAYPSVGLRTAAVPLQTQAFFGPAPVAAGLAPAGVATKLTPVEEPASENIPQADEDPSVQATRGALEPNRENSSDDFNGRPEEPLVADDNGNEEQSSNN